MNETNLTSLNWKYYSINKDTGGISRGISNEAINEPKWNLCFSH